MVSEREQQQQTAKRGDRASGCLACFVVLGTACSSDLGPTDVGTGETSFGATSFEDVATANAGSDTADQTGTEAGTQGTTTGADHGTVSSGTTSQDSTGVPIDCALQNSVFECEPMDCNNPIYQFECGGPNKFDDNGCLRAWCQEDGDCARGEVCLGNADCAGTGCQALSGCEPLDGECTCTFIGGCEDPPDPPSGWCIPADADPC